MSSLSIANSTHPCLIRWPLRILVAAAVWILACTHLTDLVVEVIGLQRGTRTAEAVHFFIYDTPEVLLLLTGIVFGMGVVALSLPGMILLRKALKVKLTAIHVSIVATGIILVGYIFNMIL